MILLSPIIELHFEQVSTFNLCNIVDNKLIVEKRGLNYKCITSLIPVFCANPNGTYTYSSTVLPVKGAFFPNPFVEDFPAGSRLA